MRRMDLALALVIAALPVAACGGDTPRLVFPSSHIPVPPLPTPAEPEWEEPPAPKLSMAEVQRSAVTEALAALNAHDAKRFAAMYAESAVLSVAGFDEVSGRAAIEENTKEWFETFKDVRVGFSRVWSKGEALVIEWALNGTHHGELFGKKGTERPIGHLGLSVLTFDGDGKVAREQRYADLGAVMAQIGGAKAKAPAVPELPGEPKKAAASGTPEEQRGLEVVRALCAALAPGQKTAGVLDLVADDVTQEGLAHLEPSKGKAGAQKLHKAFTTAFPDAKLELTNALAVGEHVIAEAVLEATHKGPLGKIAATRKPVKTRIAAVFHVKDGAVSGVRAYQNALDLDAQLGVFRAPAGDRPASQAMPALAAPATKPAPAAPAK